MIDWHLINIYESKETTDFWDSNQKEKKKEKKKLINAIINV
jgi:hypothetical protein